MSEDCARGRGSRGTGSVTRGATSRAHLRASRTSAASASAGSPGRTVAPGVRERRQLSKGARGRGYSDTAWAPCSTKSWVFRNGRSCQVRKDGLSPRRADSERPASPWRGGQVDVSAAADVIPGPREPRARVRDADGSDGIEEPSLAGDRGPQRRVQVEASVKALLVQTRMSPSPGAPQRFVVVRARDRPQKLAFRTRLLDVSRFLAALSRRARLCSFMQWGAPRVEDFSRAASGDCPSLSSVLG
jgi:hypothetical protein